MSNLLLDLSLDEINRLLSELNQPKFRAEQLYKWVQSGADWSEMTNIPKELLNTLAQNYRAQGVEIYRVFTSKDGTKKFLYKLFDGNIIEGVFMSYKYGNTLCVSTQVGCRMNCAFCASGLEGLIRNLSAGEILGQITAVNRLEGGSLAKRAVTNVVLMGSGEPLDNFDNVLKFLRLATDARGLNISARNISLSTSGLAPKIRELADCAIPVTLTVSLHAADDSARTAIMPVNKAYNIAEVIDACKYYFEKTGRRYIFEYALIAGKNDSDAEAEKLAALLKGLPCHVNIIRLNYVKERGLKASDNTADFLKILTDRNISTTIRRSMGADIEGACGQLRNKFVGDNKP